MAYTALPDRRIPYDNDGTVVGYGAAANDSDANRFAQGVSSWLSGAQMIEFNDDDFAVVSSSFNTNLGSGLGVRPWWAFFPETREVTAEFLGFDISGTVNDTTIGLSTIEGSGDSTNGVDGTWETASLPGGRGHANPSLDGWRKTIKPVSFTGGKRTIRWTVRCNTGGTNSVFLCAHWYGEKTAGQTPDDVIFINHDDTPGVEYAAPEDFGDQPLGTTVVRQFRLKNVSGTKTANTINMQCNDTDFSISEDGAVWVTTINITSLSAGAESATMYVRCVTPGPGALLGPRFNRIIVTVGSYT